MTKVLELAKQNFEKAIQVPFPYQISAGKNYKLERKTRT